MKEHIITENEYKNLKEELKKSREEYQELYQTLIKTYLHKKFVKAQLFLYKVQQGIINGKEYIVNYRGVDLKLIRAINVIDPLDIISIKTLNLASMESVEPKMKVEVEFNNKKIIKEILYYRVKEYTKVPDNADYEF